MINFPEKGWDKKDDYKVNGFVCDENENKKYEFIGKWNSYLDMIDLKTGV